MNSIQSLLVLWHIFRLQAGQRMLGGALLAALTVLSGVALLGLSGWFITATAIAGLSTATALAFNVFGPSAGIRLLALGRTASRYAERMVTHDVTLDVLASLRERLFLGWSAPGAATRLLAHPARLLFRIMADVDALDALYLRVVLPLSVVVFSSVFVALLLGVLNVFTGLGFGLAVLAGAVLPAWVAARQARSLVAERVLQLEEFRRESIDLVSGHIELIMTGTLPAAFARQQSHQTQLAFLETALGRIDAHAAFLHGLVAHALVAAALFSAWWLVDTNLLSVAQAALLVLVVLAASEPFTALRRGALELARTLIAAARLAPRFASVGTSTSPDSPALYNSEPDASDILLTDVSVVHENATAPVLSGLSLRIRAGERVAIIGCSGAGKSSLLNVLAGELPVHSGRYQHPGSALLTQASYIFHDTLAGNLRVADPLATDEKLWQVLGIAGLDADVRAMPDGLETIPGERGAGLSGGQARRLALARLLLRKVPVWLLDEPTEALDTVTADRVMDAIFRAAGTRTLVMATHLYREARHAERLILMRDGSVCVDTRRGEPAFETLLFSLRQD
ncbi:MAG: ATP-binding cassette domain-containing protein [Alcaligenaceae bacterium]|nr:ATP-binding cassette domain-containing protein [Alcaligenaceae bacterium]